MSNEAYIQTLHDELDFYRDRAFAWKALAKKYQRLHAWTVAHPGLAVARMVMHVHDTEIEGDVAAVLGAQACEAMGWAFLEYLQRHPEAKNYLEVTLSGGDEKPLYVTVQRPGGQTPHQMRVQAEAERDRLRAELEGLRAQGPCRS